MKSFGYLAAISVVLITFWFIREKQCQYANMRFSMVVGQCVALEMEGVR